MPQTAPDAAPWLQDASAATFLVAMGSMTCPPQVAVVARAQKGRAPGRAGGVGGGGGGGGGGGRASAETEPAAVDFASLAASPFVCSMGGAGASAGSGAAPAPMRTVWQRGAAASLAARVTRAPRAKSPSRRAARPTASQGQGRQGRGGAPSRLAAALRGQAVGSLASQKKTAPGHCSRLSVGRR